MTGKIADSKLSGTVQFVNANPFFSIGPYTTLFHLFEHDYKPGYKPGVQFWYGMADISCTEQDLFRDVKSAGFAVSDPGFILECAMHVSIEDGRLGDSRIISSTWTWGTQGDYMEIAFVGKSRLEVPFVPPPVQP
jgi:hypothetical protein